MNIQNPLEVLHVTSIEKPDPYRNLAIGIVEGNVMDLDRVLRRKAQGRSKADDDIIFDEIYTFFHSGWFVFLTLDKLDGPTFYNKLLDNFERTGSVYADRIKYMTISKE